MQFELNLYPSRTKPDPVRDVSIPLNYYKPRRYLHTSRYGNQPCIRAKHRYHPNKFVPQSFEYSRARETHSTVYRRAIPLSDGDRYYTVTKISENRLDIISNEYYNTPTLWWVIAQANPEIRFNPFDVPYGMELRIPSVTTLYGSGGVLSD